MFDRDSTTYSAVKNEELHEKRTHASYINFSREQLHKQKNAESRAEYGSKNMYGHVTPSFLTDD